MRVPLEKRTLRGGHHDKIYQFFEEHKICKYIKDEDFLSFIRNLTKYKGVSQGDELKEFVDLVHEFIQVRGWENDLRSIGYGRFLTFCNELHLLDDSDPMDRPEGSYHQLCYHLGQIVFDYIELNN